MVCDDTDVKSNLWKKCVGCRILKYSREYRSVIKACIVDINRQLGVCGFCIFSNCFYCVIICIFIVMSGCLCKLFLTVLSTEILLTLFFNSAFV